MKIKANNGKTYTLPDNPEWHDGPPPSVGWWPASRSGKVDFIRYWSAEKGWSQPTTFTDDEIEAGFVGNKTAFDQHEIQWSPRWWL